MLYACAGLRSYDASEGAECRRKLRARRTQLKAEFVEDEHSKLARRLARLERIVSDQVPRDDRII